MLMLMKPSCPAWCTNQLQGAINCETFPESGSFKAAIGVLRQTPETASTPRTRSPGLSSERFRQFTPLRAIASYVGTPSLSVCGYSLEVAPGEVGRTSRFVRRHRPQLFVASPYLLRKESCKAEPPNEGKRCCGGYPVSLGCDSRVSAGGQDHPARCRGART